jgi:large subunit ribosomal protein L19
MDLIKLVEAEQKREGIEPFAIGDTLKVHYRIIEGKTERIQVFEGLCIAQKNAGVRKTFTVRKISYGVGVERVFPVSSPRVAKVEVVRHGRVRRAKLYYMRKRFGKAARVTELIQKKEEKEEEAPRPAE